MKTKKKKKENMGQKVGGYRRNERYGTKTVRIPLDKGEEGRSWRFEVNPKGRVGWDRGNVRRNETGYGSSLSQGRRRRDQVEELRKGYGCTTNGEGEKEMEKEAIRYMENIHIETMRRKKGEENRIPKSTEREAKERKWEEKEERKKKRRKDQAHWHGPKKWKEEKPFEVKTSSRRKEKSEEDD